MGRTRAWRRKQYFKRREAWFRLLEAQDKELWPRGRPDPRDHTAPWWENRTVAAKYARTQKLCSCAGCGNFRKNKRFFRRKEWRSMQEQRSDGDFRSQLDDLWVKVWWLHRFAWS